MEAIAIDIRSAVRGDAAQLSALSVRAKAHWGYTEEFLAACREELTIKPEAIDSAGYCCRIARPVEPGSASPGDVPITTILGFYAIDSAAAAQYELDALFVEPRYIGRGIGRRLFGHALATLGELGGKRLLIQSDPHAEAFYVAMGAVRCGSRPSDSIPGRELPLLRYDLA